MINYEYEDSVNSAKVLSRSGKVTSETLKNRFNVESDGQSMSLNLEHVLCVESSQLDFSLPLQPCLNGKLKAWIFKQHFCKVKISTEICWN